MDVARLLTILTLLQDGPGLSARALADRCEVSLRTAQRDLDTLVRLGFPVQFDNGYRLAPPALLPPLQFTPEEAFAARVALSGNDTPSARSAGARLAVAIDPAFVPVAPSEGPQLPLGLRPAADAAATGRLADLHRAIAERRAVRVAEGMDRRSARETVLEPYRILFARGRWWVVGYAPARHRTIALAADRLRGVTVTGRRFREREGVRLERILARLGPGAAPPFAAALRLLPGAAPLAGGLPAGWLKTLEQRPDGSARLTLATPHPDLLLAWVLALGDAAEVLGPPALRAELARRGLALVKRYAPDGAS